MRWFFLLTLLLAACPPSLRNPSGGDDDDQANDDDATMSDDDDIVDDDDTPDDPPPPWDDDDIWEDPPELCDGADLEPLADVATSIPPDRWGRWIEAELWFAWGSGRLVLDLGDGSEGYDLMTMDNYLFTGVEGPGRVLFEAREDFPNYFALAIEFGSSSGAPMRLFAARSMPVPGPVADEWGLLVEPMPGLCSETYGSDDAEWTPMPLIFGLFGDTFGMKVEVGPGSWLDIPETQQTLEVRRSGEYWWSEPPTPDPLDYSVLLQPMQWDG